MKKWAIAAIIYLAAVIGGYQVYAQFFQDDQQTEHSPAGHEIHSENSAHEHGGHNDSLSEIQADVEYKDSKFTITLTDKNGNPYNDLEINHEKLMHFIVVGSDLGQYYHLHPEKVGEGKFQVQQNLPEGSYKAFVDIKPKSGSYAVMPNDVFVGDAAQSLEGGLKQDSSFKKTVDGKTVEMKIDGKMASKPVTLSFELDRTKLEPYLGAMGHVVILDEKAEHYLHVHPLKEDEPVFETQFDKPGLYKIWAEFKQDGKVRVFPFVVEIK